jgi:transcriptional regulator of arginine metabolism
MYKYSMPLPQRRQLITQRLKEGPVTSQDDLAAWLATRGLTVTQATISRDFRAIGVVKGSAGYALPDAAHTASVSDNGTELDTLLARHVLSFNVADALVVLKTAPGHANVLAWALDLTPPKDCVGTIAGDDTIFVATNSRSAASKLASRLRARAGFDDRQRHR